MGQKSDFRSLQFELRAAPTSEQSANTPVAMGCAEQLQGCMMGENTVRTSGECHQVPIRYELPRSHALGHGSIESSFQLNQTTSALVVFDSLESRFGWQL